MKAGFRLFYASFVSLFSSQLTSLLASQPMSQLFHQSVCSSVRLSVCQLVFLANQWLRRGGNSAEERREKRKGNISESQVNKPGLRPQTSDQRREGGGGGEIGRAWDEPSRKARNREEWWCESGVRITIGSRRVSVKGGGIIWYVETSSKTTWNGILLLLCLPCHKRVSGWDNNTVAWLFKRASQQDFSWGEKQFYFMGREALIKHFWRLYWLKFVFTPAGATGGQH